VNSIYIHDEEDQAADYTAVVDRDGTAMVCIATPELNITVWLTRERLEQFAAKIAAELERAGAPAIPEEVQK
jgi:hypothetical protein